MELKLIYSDKDRYPVCGFFIEGPELESWLQAINELGINPLSIELFGLPTSTPNVIWGCIVLGDATVFPEELGKHTRAHLVAGQLVIPEKSDVYPTLTSFDIEALFKSDKYVLHPDLGFFKLEDPIVLKDLVHLPDFEELDTIKPVNYTLISPQINSFRIEATPIEELQEELDAGIKREKINTKPLSFIEKARLKIYKQFITEDGENTTINPSMSRLEQFAKSLGIDGTDSEDMKNRMLEDFKNLNDRNKKEVDRLMDMLKNNPEEALRFAIPLDEHGYNRGGPQQEFKLQDRGIDFSLFGRSNRRSGFGGTVDLGDEFYRLERQYRTMAEDLQHKGDFEKAAFVYLKLLKDYQKAGETLRQGGLYEKAALVYLDYAKDELKAAACYEDGKIYDKAIEYYKKNDKIEKAGDLYVKLGKHSIAKQLYQHVVNDYLTEKKYLKAAFLSKDKQFDIEQSRKILLMGWQNNIDEFNCLNNYLNSFPEEEELWNQIKHIKNHKLNERNEVVFLDVLKYEYKKQTVNTSKIQDLAYTLISDMLERGAISSRKLLSFNTEDIRLSADALRYQINKNKRLKA